MSSFDQNQFGQRIGSSKNAWLIPVTNPNTISNHRKNISEVFGLKKQLTILTCTHLVGVSRSGVLAGTTGTVAASVRKSTSHCSMIVPAKRLNRWWMSMDFPSIFLWFYHVQWIVFFRKISTGEAISICSYEISGVPPVILFPETFIHCHGRVSGVEESNGSQMAVVAELDPGGWLFRGVCSRGRRAHGGFIVFPGGVHSVKILSTTQIWYYNSVEI